MDCEGSEVDIIMAVRDWGGVRVIRFEWHRQKVKPFYWLGRVWKKLEKDGFKVVGDRYANTPDQLITATRK